MFRIRLFVVLFGILGSFDCFTQADIVLWLSGEPPSGSKGLKKSGMQHYFVQPGKRGSEDLVLFFREGVDFQNNVYRKDSLTENERFVSFSPSGEYHEYNFKYLQDSNLVISYPFRQEGYFNFYLLKKYVHNDTLFVHTAKAERLSHKCRSGHKDILKKIRPNKVAGVPFELVRKRMSHEDLHVMIESGSEIQFQALFNSKPVQNAKISVTTQKGWNKKIVSNEEGEVQFQLISDYFSNLQEIEKKHISRMLISGYFDSDEKGRYQEQDYSRIVYTTSLELQYIPASLLYKSRTWAVWVILLSTIILSIAIFWLFKRNTRKWQKIVNDE